VSAIDTDRFRSALLEERQRVVGAIEEMPIDNHLAENASVTLDREIDYSLEENSEEILSSIDRALERIENGTYGTCRSCKREIGEARLEALPRTDLCIACASRGRR
jgi:RNA polymerase-binding protein DksA